MASLQQSSQGEYSLDAQKDKLKKYAEFQDIYCHAGGREHEAILSVEDWKTA